jgi:hypothetical protein
MDNQNNSTMVSGQPDQSSQNDQSTQTCANCGMPKAEWRGNNGQGLEMAGKMYCCSGCASGSGCTCA